MKITNQPGYGVYKSKFPENSHGASVKGSASGAARMDRNSIIHGSTAVSDRQLLLLKSSVQDFVSAPAGRDRLDAIRDGIQNGTYRVPTGDLVNAVMADETFS